MKYIYLFIIFAISHVSIATDKNTPYNKSANALEIMQQVYFVNHFYSFKNYGFGKKGQKIATLVMRDKGSKRPVTIAFERYLNNNINKEAINSKDLVIFRSGRLKKMGVLITDYIDNNKTQLYEIFMPSIRKIRKLSKPAQNDSWGGSDFTLGDIMLRKPKDETHELLDTAIFNGCIHSIKLPKEQRNKYTRKIKIKDDCALDNKKVYRIKSVYKLPNWWYDYRISIINAETFADNRIEFFKNGKKIKIIEKSWIPHKNNKEKRANLMKYWYAKTLETGHETFIYIPQKTIKINYKFKTKNLWSSKTLKKLPKVVK